MRYKYNGKRKLEVLLQTPLSTVKALYRKAIKYLAETNYYSAKAFYNRQLHISSMKYGKPPLLIHQMGKVGSSTVYKTLSPLDLGRPIYHVHYLSKDRVVELEKDRKRYFHTEKYYLLKRPWLYQYLLKQLDRVSNGKKWKIITLTREPIARNISTFFENLEVNVIDRYVKYEIKSDYYDINPIIIKLENLNELVDLFFNRLDHDSPLSFFDREIEEVYGIDVYSSEFPQKKGYKIYEGRNIELLIIRLESLNSCVRNALKEFLNSDVSELLNTNIGRRKDYAPIYEEVKKSLVVPHAYIERMYNSRYMRHFYSEDEIKNFEAKWRSSGTFRASKM